MIRALTRMSGGDAVVLAVYEAASAVGISNEEAKTIIGRLRQHAGTMYPPGFM